MFKNSLSLSMEAIFQQENSELRRELIEALDTLPGKGLRNVECWHKLQLDKIMKRHTNIPFIVSFEPGLINAGVYSPRMSASNPIYGNMRDYGSNDTAIKYLQKAKAPIKGWIDRRNSKVHGVFEEIDVAMEIGTGLMDCGISSAGVASIILHEIGHVFSYYEFLSSTCTMNLVLLGIQKAYLDKQPAVELVTLFETVEDLLKITIEDKAKLAQNTGAEEAALVVAKETMEQFRSVNGYSLYDDNGWEFAADQFCQRHGGAKDLVIANNIMDREFDSRELLGSSARFLLQTYDFFVEVLRDGLYTLGIIPIFRALFFNPLLGTYDRDGYRIERLLRQEMERLKNPGLSAEAKKAIADDVKTMKEIRAQYKEFEFLFDKLFVYLMPSRNKAAKEQGRQQILEYLGTSDLLLAGARFSNL